MIQHFINSFTGAVKTYYINLSDTVLETSEYRPLMELISKQTGNKKYFRPAIYGKVNERYYTLTVGILNTIVENPLGGLIHIGKDSSFPVGEYELNLYNNTSDTNLNPSGLVKVWEGLVNFHITNSTKVGTQYTKYTTNDPSQQTVYTTHNQ